VYEPGRPHSACGLGWHGGESGGRGSLAGSTELPSGMACAAALRYAQFVPVLDHNMPRTFHIQS